MLTLNTVTPGAKAVSYYAEKDDYYTKDSSEVLSSYWQGRGAEIVHLHGEIKPEDFQSMLKGLMPDGSKIHVGGHKRCGGTDMTFAAPKSVSIQALVIGDHHALEAHDRAVQRVMQYVEEQTQARNGEYTNNIVVASFTHTLNRNTDPHLHTHNVVINATLKKDSQWRAIDNRWIYNNKLMLGAMYRAELALELQALGFEIRRTHADGCFELANYTPEQIEKFSTRSKDIEAALAKQGLSRKEASAALKQTKALTTRLSKKDIDKALLRQVWRDKAAALGITLEKPHGQVDRNHDQNNNNKEGYKNKVTLEKNHSANAIKAVDYAIDHLTDREAVIKIQEVQRFALEHGIGKIRLANVNTEIERRIKSGSLYRHGDELTTDRALFRENDILRITEVGKGTLAQSITSLERVNDYLTTVSLPLTQGQKEAIRLIATTKDRVIGIRGRAGTGKTTMLNHAKQIAENNGYKVIGLAPTKRATRELNNIGINSTTAAKFISNRNREVNSNSLIILDEAGMVSAKMMRQLLRIAERAGARIVLVGDESQLKAIGAGRPFDQLQKAGMETMEMNEIQRQLNERYKESVRLAAEGKMRESLSLVEKNVVEVIDDSKRYQAIAKGYAALSEKERQSTIVVSGTNEARKAINHVVRQELGLQGGQTVNVLLRVDLTSAQMKEVENYLPGMIVEAERKYESLGIAKGDRLTVEKTNSAKGTITLRHENGTPIEWSPRKYTNFTAYKQNTLELTKGDSIQFLKADGKSGIESRDFAQVIDMNTYGMKVRSLDSGKELFLPLDRPIHVDYGYASTIHSSQGATVKRVIVDLDTRFKTTNDAAFYVALSRGKEALRIYTNDLKKLPEAIQRVSRKRAALELTEKKYGRNFLRLKIGNDHQLER